MMAKKAVTPRTTQPIVSNGKTKKDKLAQSSYQQNLFLAMALNMTWQLAIVVLIPLVGGYKLDQHFDSSPLYTLIGLVVAISGVAAVLARVLKEAKEHSDYNERDKK